MLTLGVIKSPWCTHQAMRAIVIKIIDQPRKIREFGRAVTYPGRLGARYTGLGAQNLNFFFSVAIQQRNMLKKSKWLRRQKINTRRRIERIDCQQKCFHSFK